MGMKRFTFDSDGVCLSYLDSGVDAPLLLAMHGHFGCARNFSPLTQALAQDYRVVALDQRGHGWSEHPEDCSRGAYVKDIRNLARHLSPERPLFLLGHSLGGVNAYQFAAQHPAMVSALVVEDIGVHVSPRIGFATDWPHRYASLSDLLELLADRGLSGDRYFLDSVCEHEDGWGFRFNPHWIARSQQAVTGDWSGDWLQLQCPVLLLHGTRSRDMRTEDGQWMRANHPDCTYLEFSAGHTIHDELPDEFADAVRSFLRAQA
ncbi:alpha/beta fold hydrolase [Collimonas pratensis]|nr:alpha/beta fold hydrolase [Collimonas pratensis]